MKKVCCILLSFTFWCCSDGDIQIETLDFDSFSIQDCADIDVTISNILFKINAEESLILELQSGILNNGNSESDTIETTSSIPSQSRLIYRVFSDNVTSSYFCEAIPPAEPRVIKEIEAEMGTITVKSIAINDSTEFSHTIQFSDISLTNVNNERITDLSINDFGVITTPITN